jgi:hypothetical protein
MARGLGSLFKFFRRGTKKIDEPTPQSVDEAVVVGKQDPSVPIKTPAVVAKPPVKLEPLQNKYTGPLQMGDATTRSSLPSMTGSRPRDQENLLQMNGSIIYLMLRKKKYEVLLVERIKKRLLIQDNLSTVKIIME